MAYIADLRALVGHRPLILTSASGALIDKDGAILLQERADTGDWGFPGGYMVMAKALVRPSSGNLKKTPG